MLLFTNVHRCQNWRTSSFYPGHEEPELAVVSRQLAGIWTNVPGNWVILLHDAQQMRRYQDILFTNWERSWTCWAWEARSKEGSLLVYSWWWRDESCLLSVMNHEDLMKCHRTALMPHVLHHHHLGQGGACAANVKTTVCQNGIKHNLEMVASIK